MRLLVTGKSGQVARSLVERGAARGDAILTLGRPEIDLEHAADRDRLAAAIAGFAPDVVVSAAAYTAVDRAESEAERACALNRDGAGAVARAAAALSVPLIHLSTDYVYDGTKGAPYREDDACRPLSVYGRSKLDGEAAVRAAAPDAVILRTAWVYGPFGGNFVQTMLRLAGERDRLRVVDDQWGHPTSSLDLAEGILAIARRLRESGPAPAGIFHLAGGEAVTWCGFARGIMAASAAAGGPNVPVEAIGTADYPTPACRPADSRLDLSKAREAFGLVLPSWRDAIPAVVRRILTASDRTAEGGERSR